MVVFLAVYSHSYPQRHIILHSAKEYKYPRTTTRIYSSVLTPLTLPQSLLPQHGTAIHDCLHIAVPATVSLSAAWRAFCDFRFGAELGFLDTLIRRSSFSFFFYDYYYYLKISDKLAKFYDVGWLLYQCIFNTFRNLPYPCCTMSYSILFSYFHILFSYSKLYSKILFVPTATTWVE